MNHSLISSNRQVVRTLHHDSVNPSFVAGWRRYGSESFELAQFFLEWNFIL